MATQFRQLGPDDAEALAARLEVWHGAEGAVLEPGAIGREVELLLRDNERWHAWLIESQGEATGYLMLQFRTGGMFEAPRAYVAALYLIPEARHRGLGELAHRFVTELSRWLQVRVYDFDTARENKHAQLFSRHVKRAGNAGHHPLLQATA
jgi:GNAT superfamily N-acetyltransferase